MVTPRLEFSFSNEWFLASAGTWLGFSLCGGCRARSRGLQGGKEGRADEIGNMPGCKNAFERRSKVLDSETGGV
jgi:hypothetical protein